MSIEEQVRKEIDTPVFRGERAKIANELARKRGYAEEYSWELAGLLMEEFARARYKTMSKACEDMMRGTFSRDAIEWAEDKSRR